MCGPSGNPHPQINSHPVSYYFLLCSTPIRKGGRERNPLDSLFRTLRFRPLLCTLWLQIAGKSRLLVLEFEWELLEWMIRFFTQYWRTYFCKNWGKQGLVLWQDIRGLYSSPSLSKRHPKINYLPNKVIKIVRGSIGQGSQVYNNRFLEWNDINFIYIFIYILICIWTNN